VPEKNDAVPEKKDSVLERLLEHLGARPDPRVRDPLERLLERGSKLAASLLSISRSTSRLRTLVVGTLLGLVVLVVAVLHGADQPEFAGDVVELAKFVIPTLFAADAAIRYGESRLICCVLDHEPVASGESAPETAPEQR
jgi:hypothetical protein